MYTIRLGYNLIPNLILSIDRVSCLQFDRSARNVDKERPINQIKNRSNNF